MKAIDRLRAAVQAFRAKEPIEKAPWSQSIYTIFASALDTAPWLSGSALTQPYKQHPTVYAAVSAIASNLAALPLEFFPLGDEEKEEPDPEARPLLLIQKPNPLMVGNQLIEATIINMELYGNAFWFKDQEARRNGGESPFPRVLECWDPCKVRPVMREDNLIGWEYRTQNTTIKVNVDRVIHFKKFNPYDPVWGLSPLDAAITIAGADYLSQIWNKALFENHAIPYGLLSPEAGNSLMDKDALVRLRDQIEARHGGAAKHGKLGAINFPVKFTEIGTNQKDIDFPTLLDKATEKILMIWKVPPVVAGVLKDANYSVSLQQSKQFWHNQMPTLKYLEASIYEGLCKPYGIKLRPYFKAEMVKALTEDQESVSNTARNFWNMGVPFRDINERFELGFPADDITADTSWIPFSLVNGDEQAMAPAMEDTGGPTRGPRQGEEQNQPGDESTVANDPTQGKRMAQGSELYRRLNWRTIISTVRDQEMAMEKRLRDHFHGLKVEVLRKISGGPKSIKAPPLFTVDVVMFDRDKAARDVESRTEPLFKSSIKAGLDSISSVISEPVQFDLLDPQIQKFMAEKMFEIADLVDGPAEERLRNSLQEGIRLGESIEGIADRVEEVFAVERSRARRIARTEVAEAFNSGRFSAIKQANIQNIEWLSARDERVRDSHQRLDGEVVAVGDRFSNGLLYPLDPNGPPEEIVNCRCVALPA